MLKLISKIELEGLAIEFNMHHEYVASLPTIFGSDRAVVPTVAVGFTVAERVALIPLAATCPPPEELFLRDDEVGATPAPADPIAGVDDEIPDIFDAEFCPTA